ncbi:MAG: hydroxymethylbilane synthase [Nitrospiria bacterium]
MIKIGSRGSKLALWQAEWVRSRLKAQGIESEICHIQTSGDKILDVPLAKVGGKGLFVKEIEEALLREEIDMAVHSMKDLPSALPDGLHIAAVTQREDPRDALVSREGLALADLPQGARVGTSSLRRQAQLLSLRPDLKIGALRGNLNTRLKKLKEGRFDAILLAAAGLHRLGWREQITEYLPTEHFLPAIGQGALGIECRKDDPEVQEMILPLNHSETSMTVKAERAMLDRLEGGCQVPIGGHATLSDGNITLMGLVAGLDGKVIVRENQSLPYLEAGGLGVSVAEALLAKGARSILEALYSSGEHST